MYCSDPDELGRSKVSFEHAGSIARTPGAVRALFIENLQGNRKYMKMYSYGHILK